MCAIFATNFHTCDRFVCVKIAVQPVFQVIVSKYLHGRYPIFKVTSCYPATVIIIQYHVNIIKLRFMDALVS